VKNKGGNRSTGTSPVLNMFRKQKKLRKEWESVNVFLLVVGETRNARGGGLAKDSERDNTLREH